MLTQNYRAVYQFQDDQRIYSQASKENVLICPRKGGKQLLGNIGQNGNLEEANPRKWEVPTCAHSTSLFAISLEARRCTHDLFSILCKQYYINNVIQVEYKEIQSQTTKLDTYSNTVNWIITRIHTHTYICMSITYQLAAGRLELKW